MSLKQIEEFNSGNEIDYSIGIPGISRFRVNVYSQRGNICAAYRRLPLEPPAIDSLGLPNSVVDLLDQKKGLILVKHLHPLSIKTKIIYQTILMVRL